MTDTFIIQCPHCQTSFRLKPNQLAAAGGSVRCGACLKVFNAASQISVKHAELGALLGSKLRANNQPPATVKPTDRPHTTDSPAETPPAQATHRTATVTPDELDELDLDAELARLEQEERQEHSTPVSQATLNDRPALPSASTEEDWSDELLASESAPPLSSPRPAVTKQPDTATASATQPKPVTARQVNPEQVAHPGTAATSLSAVRHFADEPIRLDWRPKKNPWKRWLAWGLLNALAVLLLIGQYTQHNFTQLARHDSSRPWLEALCPLIDCQLPAKVDVQHIKSSNLLVRSHPEFSGALLVDAIIYNRASFAQPFPLLELTFSNQDNQLIAKRLFTPMEYLAGELAGQKYMPPQVPIHIGLEVLEPSGGVLSYQLNFVSPDAARIR